MAPFRCWIKAYCIEVTPATGVYFWIVLMISCGGAHHFTRQLLCIFLCVYMFVLLQLMKAIGNEHANSFFEQTMTDADRIDKSADMLVLLSVVLSGGINDNVLWSSALVVLFMDLLVITKLVYMSSLLLLFTVCRLIRLVPCHSCWYPERHKKTCLGTANSWRH